MKNVTLLIDHVTTTQTLRQIEGFTHIDLIHNIQRQIGYVVDLVWFLLEEQIKIEFEEQIKIKFRNLKR